jgi:hypothetical protein
MSKNIQQEELKIMSEEEVKEIYNNYPKEFREKYRLTKKRILYLRVLFANLNVPIVDDYRGPFELAKKQLGLAPKCQLRHLRYRPSGNSGFPLDGSYGEVEGPGENTFVLNSYKPHPKWKPKQKNPLTDEEWSKLLEKYGNKCACCFSNVKIEKGHLDPKKLLTFDNCAPMCHKCNHQTSANGAIYKKDETSDGRSYVRVSYSGQKAFNQEITKLKEENDKLKEENNKLKEQIKLLR